MTTSPVKSLIDEQLEDAEQELLTLVSSTDRRLPDLLGLPASTRLVDTPIRGAMTIRGGRRVLEVRA